MLEPRTATTKKRLETLSLLSEQGISVNVMPAPYHSGNQQHEGLPLAKAAANAGARSVGYTAVRLNGSITFAGKQLKWVTQFIK